MLCKVELIGLVTPQFFFIEKGTRFLHYLADLQKATHAHTVDYDCTIERERGVFYGRTSRPEVFWYIPSVGTSCEVDPQINNGTQ